MEGPVRRLKETAYYRIVCRSCIKRIDKEGGLAGKGGPLTGEVGCEEGREEGRSGAGSVVGGSEEGRASARKEGRFGACGVKGGKGEGVDTASASASVLLVEVFADRKSVN